MGKGDKFHYVQRPAQYTLFATGMNGDEDLGEDITTKGDKFHYVQRPANDKLFATGMNGDEDLGEDITMKGDKFHYVQRQPVKGVTFAQEDPEAAPAEAPAVDGPEKVHVLDPKICKTHTT